jgi:hypothetical protein
MSGRIVVLVSLNTDLVVTLPRPAKRFGFIQSHDPKPRRHLAAVLDSQGLQHNQELVFLSDGEESLRQLQCYSSSGVARSGSAAAKGLNVRVGCGWHRQ